MNGKYVGETLVPETDQLFEAIRTEKIDEFLIGHPQFINAEK